MKILLFGEYSALHKNLQEGLRELGYYSKLVSSGDGYKKIPSDISLSVGSRNIFGKCKTRIEPFFYLPSFKSYDIVQLMSPYFLKYKYFPATLYYQILKKLNKRFFVLAAGSDPYFWRYAKLRMRYGPFDDNLKYDIKKDSSPFLTADDFIFNEKVVGYSDGIIAGTVEGFLSYEGHPNLISSIPIPINTDKIKYQENVVKGKIKIFHGLSRYGFKGTRHVEKAFQVLSEKYPNDLELIIDGRMPLNEYLEILRTSNVVIDQTSTYGLGVNGIYSLAMGKVVLGGAEPEDLSFLRVNKTPVINILPDYKSIVTSVERLLEKKDEIKSLGFQSRLFAEKIYGHRVVAKKYLDLWQKH